MTAFPGPPLVSVAGFSNSGKTTLISRLIGVFSAEGLKVAAIKHAHHGFSMDLPGKDTGKHRDAGAYGVLAVSPGMVALIRDVEPGPTPSELARLYFPDADLVLVEGYKFAPIPKLVIAADQAAFSAFEGDPNVIAYVGEPSFDTSLPVFGRDDIAEISGFIRKRFLAPGGN